MDVERVDVAKVARRGWDDLNEPGTLRTDGAVTVDAGSAGRLLENLLQNAVEHGSPASGDGAAPTIIVGRLGEGFYVADDGPGISEEERQRVFESGYSSEQDGTGFGLHIVERVAEAHDWEVTVTESDAGGARFEFRAAAADPSS